MAPRKKSKQNSNTKLNNSVLRNNHSTEKNFEKSKWNFVLGLVTAFAAVMTVYLSWMSYQKTLPSMRINNWEISKYSVNDTNQVTLIELLATLSNTGGAGISLISAEPKIIYKNFSPTPDTSSQNSGQGTPLGLDLRGGLQTLLEADVPTTPMPGSTPVAEPSMLEATRIILEYSKSPISQEVINEIKETGLLTFVEPEPVCLGDKCILEFKSRDPDVLFFREDNSNLQDKLNYPITIASGESVVITITWKIAPMNEEFHLTEMGLVLKFSNGDTLELNLLDKFAK